MNRGVLMFAHNNSEIDYFKIACANALMVQHNLKVPVTLVTDPGSLNWGRTDLGQELIDSCFENIICVERNYQFDNPRSFSDTSHSSKLLQFYNCNHWEAYNLSPYDETLFIDADYLIMSSALSNCWGSINDVMVDHMIYSPGSLNEPTTRYIDDFGIRLYWATVVYFKKSEFAEFLFSTIRHVQENYQYYRELYLFSGSMFRNDNALSVAIHMLNGFTSIGTTVERLPIPGLLMAWDTTDIYKVNRVNDITLYAEKEDSKGVYTLVRLKDTDVHIMNKWAINRVSTQLLSLYKKDNHE